MDDLLQKNIFDETDLRKLTPDYRPVNLYLRMQMRRALVKDTHFHGVNKCNISQRKSMKRTKDGYSKFNNEIVKLRNTFHNTNLRNEIVFKSLRSKSYLHNSELLVNSNNNEQFDDSCIFLGELPSPSDDLVIRNDKDFKINIKTKPRRPEINYNESICKKSDDFDMGIYNDEVNSNIITIDCTYVDKNSESDKNGEDIDVNINESYQKTGETTICDLQSLLSMMTLSPENNYGEISNVIERDIVDEDQSIEHTLLLENVNFGNNFTKCVDISEILNVKQMLVEINSCQKSMMKKYVDKWKKYVLKRQEIIAHERQKTLSTFFDKLEKKKSNIHQLSNSVNKANILARDYNTYQHRYKVQKHVIALQKVKLEEQHRLIEELKYNKIIDASRQSVDEMREEVRKTYYEIDRQLKPKIKCLTNELKIPEIDESTLVLQCLKVPQFLQRMEKRAREREEKHAMIRERRRQMEEERLRLKQQAELAKAEMDKDEKMRRIKELREKRKKEKIENIRRKQFAERMRALIVMADLHYEKHLKNKYGIKPFKRLLEIKQDNIEKAKTHHAFQLKKNMFLHLMWYTEDMVFERNFKAVEFHRSKILHRVFCCLKQNYHEYVLKKQVADDYYDLYIIQLVFRKFREALAMLKRENEVKLQAMVKYYNSNMMFKIFTCWRTLPALNALQREQEARKARWRTKVLQVVPDYTPPDD